MSPSILLAIYSFIARALGLITTPLLAKTFGASPELDAYFAAFRVPDLIFNLLVLGTITVAFIPIVMPMLDKKKLDQAYNFASAVFNWMAIGIGAILIILFFATPYLVPIFIEKFDQNTMALTIRLTRIMLLSPLFFSLSAVMGSICNAKNRFLPYALSPVFYKLGIIIGIIFLSPHFGIIGVAYGVIIGAIGHFAINLPTLIKLKWPWKPVLRVEAQKVKIMIKLTLPRLISIGATQINLFVDTFLATGIAVGALTIFNFADSIANIPVGIVGLSIATASYPLFSSLANKNNPDKFKKTLNQKILTIVFLMFPATIAAIFLAPDLITALFHYGKFSVEHLPTVAMVMSFFAISFIPQALIPLLTRSFYAHQKVAAPVFAAVVTLCVNATLGIIFIKILGWGVWALALSYSIAAMVNAIILLWAFILRFGKLATPALAINLAKILALNLVLWFAFYLTKCQFTDFNVFLRLAILGGGGMILYFGLAELIGLGKIWRRQKIQPLDKI
ncbi:MAG: murein biosynthesis integral membrane protein MurJ [Patescibacteria group bacterium]|nr:murein biosynthesis integral membrane protein MurJ [Patescibacteria group bacterium]